MNKQVQVLETDSNNWKGGKYGPYKFTAKVYDSGSRFGINNGRVSKLMVTYRGKIVFNYDRGIDIDHPVGNEIAAHFDRALT